MPPRPRLTTLALTRWRRILRFTLFVVIGASALLAALGYVLPAHRAVYVPDTGAWLDLGAQLGEPNFHSNLHDGGPWPLVALGVAAALAIALRRRRFGAGFVAALAGAGAAVVAIGAVLLVHLFSRQEQTIGEPVFYLSLMVLFVASCALLVAEPVVHLLEQRRLVRALKPTPLPRATLVSGAAGAC